VEIVGVALHDFHGFKVLKFGLLANLIFPVVGIIYQVAYIGNIANIPHFVAQVHKVAVEDIEAGKSAYIAKMYIAVNSGSANVQANIRRVDREKGFLFPR
jgi:hypothetical protein